MRSEEVTMVVESMTAIPYFPSEPAARALIGNELQRMCGSMEQAMWLVRRLTQLYSHWPGLVETRAVYCSKYRPCDGIEADSAVYLDGVPSEKQQMPALGAGSGKALA